MPDNNAPKMPFDSHTADQIIAEAKTMKEIGEESILRRGMYVAVSRIADELRTSPHISSYYRHVVMQEKFEREGKATFPSIQKPEELTSQQASLIIREALDKTQPESDLNDPVLTALRRGLNKTGTEGEISSANAVIEDMRATMTQALLEGMRNEKLLQQMLERIPERNAAQIYHELRTKNDTTLTSRVLCEDGQLSKDFVAVAIETARVEVAKSASTHPETVRAIARIYQEELDRQKAAFVESEEKKMTPSFMGKGTLPPERKAELMEKAETLALATAILRVQSEVEPCRRGMILSDVHALNAQIIHFAEQSSAMFMERMPAEQIRERITPIMDAVQSAYKRQFEAELAIAAARIQSMTPQQTAIIQDAASERFNVNGARYLPFEPHGKTVAMLELLNPSLSTLSQEAATNVLIKEALKQAAHEHSLVKTASVQRTQAEIKGKPFRPIVYNARKDEWTVLEPQPTLDEAHDAARAFLEEKCDKQGSGYFIGDQTRDTVVAIRNVHIEQVDAYMTNGYAFKDKEISALRVPLAEKPLLDTSLQIVAAKEAKREQFIQDHRPITK